MFSCQILNELKLMINYFVLLQSTTEPETLTHQVPPRGQLTVQKGRRDTTVRRSTHMIDQKVSELTEEVFDENLGKPVLKTYRITEKTLEHEVGCHRVTHGITVPCDAME